VRKIDLRAGDRFARDGEVRVLKTWSVPALMPGNRLIDGRLGAGGARLVFKLEMPTAPSL
jgi:hypothetical protein